MNILMISRASLYNNPGGDTIQITNTQKYLIEKGIAVDIKLTSEAIDYSSYDLLHFFNITRPSDILFHIKKSGKPFVISPIFVEYAEYDKNFRKGISGLLFRLSPPGAIEYFKIVARRIFNGEKIMSPEYLWLGHNKSIQKILKAAALLLPNSHSEFKRLKSHFSLDIPYLVVPNGIEESLFGQSLVPEEEKEKLLVLCVARIEGLKNQLQLIKALNNTKFKLLLIGKPANNQLKYFETCKKIAAHNITFIDKVPQKDLVQYYKIAKVHILPSWFETTGLSSLEAAAMNCSIVITDKGDAKEYFQDDAHYCDPASPASILQAVEEAAQAKYNSGLRKKILDQYTWHNTALKTLEAYKQVLKKP
jgi:glycosyltransferase involved in cell wall biosynthesis